jgi:hypothetical protein
VLFFGSFAGNLTICPSLVRLNSSAILCIVNRLGLLSPPMLSSEMYQLDSDLAARLMKRDPALRVDWMRLGEPSSAGRVSHVESVQLVAASSPSARFAVEQTFFLEPLYKDCLPDVWTLRRRRRRRRRRSVWIPLCGRRIRFLDPGCRIVTEPAVEQAGLAACETCVVLNC